MNNKGFIATSLLYSFFLVFCALLLGLLATFLHNRVLIDNVIDGVKEELGTAERTAERLEVGTYVKLLPIGESEAVLDDIVWLISDDDGVHKNKTLVSVSFVAKEANEIPNYVSEDLNRITISDEPSYIVRIIASADISALAPPATLELTEMQKKLLGDGGADIICENGDNIYGTIDLEENSAGCNGSVNLTTAVEYYLKLITKIPNDAVLKSGNGTEYEPYNLTVYNYNSVT